MDDETPLHTVCTNYTVNSQTVVIIKALLKQPSVMIHLKNNNDKTAFDIIKQRLENNNELDGQRQYLRDIQKNNLAEILQLFEDYYIHQRWQAYCYLIKYDLVIQKEPSDENL